MRVQDTLVLADAAEEAGDWSKAVHIWKEIVRREETPAWLVRYGRALARMDRSDEAEAAYRKALELDISCADAYFRLGILLQGQQQLDDARRALEEGLRLREEQPILTILGSVLRRLGNSEAAEHAFRRSLELNSDDDEAHFGLGVVTRGRDVEDSVAHLREAIRLDARLPGAHRELGLSLYAAGRNEDADAILVEAVALEPGDEWAHTYLGYVRERMNDWAGAQEHFRMAVELYGDSELFCSNLARVMAQAGDFAAAHRLFQRALAVNERSSIANREYGLFLKYCGETEEAGRFLRQALAEDPRDRRAQQALDEIGSS